MIEVKKQHRFHCLHCMKKESVFKISFIRDYRGESFSICEDCLDELIEKLKEFKEQEGK